MTETKNEWNNPAPKQSHKIRAAVIIVFSVLGAMILAVTLIGALGASGGGGQTAVPAPHTDSTTSAPHKVVPVPNEKADLTSFTLDDRSTAGITDIWIKMQVVNHSSKKSDYTIEWQAVNDAGVRIDSGTEVVLGVLPHQATTQPVLTTIDHTAGVHLGIVSVDRTASVD